MSERRSATSIVDGLASILVIAASVAVLLRLGISSFDHVREARAQPRPVGATASPERAALPQPTEVQFAKSETIGNLDARVGIIEYVDFECSFCATFAQDTWPALRDEYVSRGKLLFIFKQHPLPSHPRARHAAMSALCAAEQGRLADMHEGLFRQHKQQRGFDGKALASTLGLHRPSFEQCALTADATIESHITAAKAAGITGTPSFVLGKVVNRESIHVERLLIGAEPLEMFRESLERLLAQADR